MSAHDDPVAQFGAMPQSAFRAVGALASARAQDGFIVMLQSNRGFLPYLRNTVCSFRRLNVHNWMVIALDNATCPAFEGSSLDAHTAPMHGTCTFPYQPAEDGKAGSSFLSSGVASYGTKGFVQLVLQKPLWIRWLIEQGYSVLQCDLDIVWLRDPRPMLQTLRVAPQPTWSSFRAHPVTELPRDAPKLARVGIPRSGNDPHLWPKNESAPIVLPDIVVQSEQVHGLNSGFFLVRPTRASLLLVSMWLERILVQAGNFTSSRGVDEQHAFNSAVIRLKMASVGHGNFSYGALEDDIFPNGKIWWQYPMWADKRVAFIVHANWNKMQKKARLMKDGLWFLDDKDTHCRADFDPFAAGCSKLCVPVQKATLGGTTRVFLKTCRLLNLEDDKRASKHGRMWESSKGVWEDLRGQFWHPTAYQSLGCTRNTSVVAPYAAKIHEKLWARVV